ncbi:MAG: M1 family aminopeptidase [Bacteroidota bacterium]
MNDVKVFLGCVFLLFCTACRNRSSKVGEVEKPVGLNVLHQTLDIEANWDEKYLKGTTEISYEVHKTMDSIVLNASKLMVDEILLNGTPVSFVIDTENHELHIPNAKVIPKDGIHNLKISFHTQHRNESDPGNIWGSFGKGVRFFEATRTEQERRKQLWAIGEPNSSKFWFPCHDSPDDSRTTEIKVTVPKGLQAFASGTLKATEANESSTSYTYSSEIEYPTHHTFLVIGDYTNVQQSFGTIKINNYGYPDERLGTEESVVRLPDMMKFFSDYTGQTYPYPSYSQIFVQDFGGWKPGLAAALITENMIDDKTTHEDFLYGWDLTEGEALAAQWFGCYLVPENWTDAWLTKGFARYFSGLYNEHKNGKTEFLTYQFTPDLSAYLNDWNNGLVTQVVPENNFDIAAFVNGNAPYAKGARVLHMLRKELGETQWEKVILDFVENNGGKTVSTQDFIASVNRVADKNMDWFFNQWVYGVGHPIFEIQQEFDPKGKQFILRILQKQKIDSIVDGRKIPYFEGKVQLEIDQNIEELNLEAKAENTFVFDMVNPPSLVNFDYEDSWIKESDFEKSTENLLQELNLSKDVLHRQSCMQQLASKAGKEGTLTSTVEEIKNALLQRAMHEPYWRMRLVALSQLGRVMSTNQMDEGKLILEQAVEEVLLALIKREKSWMKAWTINLLGQTRHKKYVPIYLEGLKDYSDRVVFMSAIALGKTKDSRALGALLDLPKKPSWKNQSLISALYGLKELEDLRGYPLALSSLTDSNKPHWNLGTPIWDHRLAAAHALKAMDKTEEASLKVLANLDDALQTGNLNDIFYNAQSLGVLGGEPWRTSLERLRSIFSEDSVALEALSNLEKQNPIR